MKNIYGMLYVYHPPEGDPKSAVLSLKYGGLVIKSAASRYQTPKGEHQKKIKKIEIMLQFHLIHKRNNASLYLLVK